MIAPLKFDEGIFGFRPFYSIEPGAAGLANRSHGQNRHERIDDGAYVLRPRYADAQRKPDSRYAHWIEQLAAECDREDRSHGEEYQDAYRSAADDARADHDKQSDGCE